MRTRALSQHPLTPAAEDGHSLPRLADDIAQRFLLLPAGAVIALVWANVRPESYFRLAQSLAFAVNEIGMAFFLALVAQEAFEATMPGGALHTWRRWTLPMIAAAGGVVGSTLVYFGSLAWDYEPVVTPGWPLASAVDIVFAYFIVKSIFRRHAAVPFLLLLAITTNAIGLVAMAVSASALDLHPSRTILMLVALGLALLLKRGRVRSFWPYVVICGTLSWWALYLGGVHPSLALIPVVPFLPHAARSARFFEDAPHGVHDSPRHFEHVFNYPVQVILFLFGLVNAGVLVRDYGPGTWAVLLSALVGRPLGILVAIALAVSAGWHLPLHLRWRELTVLALAASCAFTFALFFATAIFALGPVLDEIKMGALSTSVGLLLALGTARLFRVGRFAGR